MVIRSAVVSLFFRLSLSIHRLVLNGNRIYVYVYVPFDLEIGDMRCDRLGGDTTAIHLAFVSEKSFTIYSIHLSIFETWENLWMELFISFFLSLSF